MAAFGIGRRVISAGGPCFVIAEAGSNHNGDLAMAVALIDVAAQAGADAVKFQMFRADALYPPNAGVIDEARIGAPIHQALSALELPERWLPTLRDRARDRGLEFLVSVFDEQSADAADPYVSAFKIASYELTHHPLIRHVAGKGKPLIISTGVAELSEVAETVAVAREAGATALALLQCTAEYPAPIESLNLAALVTMRQQFDVPTGLSDHSEDPWIGPIAAVALGATVVEKHFTLSNKMPGPDHEFALEPDELSAMVRSIRMTEVALGSGIKSSQPVEALRRAFGRRTLFVTTTVEPGTRFTTENIKILRCGVHEPGLPPRDYERVLGAKAARKIDSYTPIRAEDVST